MQAPLIVAAAAAVQLAAGAVLPTNGVCPASHPIKAIVTPRTQECVYQRPEDPHYRTIRPDMCFRSEEDARQDDCWQAKDVL